MFFPTFILGSVTLILLHMASGASSDPIRTQKYKILDPAGLESSFLLEGGKLIITCNSTDASEELTLVESSDYTNPIKTGKGEISHKFDLEKNLIGKSYQCFPAFEKGLFKIKNFICDPFSITPMTTDCKDPQVCMMSKDGSASCVELTDKDCFVGRSLQEMKDLSMSSFPKFKYACTDELKADKNSHGLCYAKSMNVKDIHAISNNPDVCYFFKSANLNGIKADQGSFLTESRGVSSWKIEFVVSTDPHNFTCKLYDKTNRIVAEFAASNGQTTAVYKALSTSKNINVPDKLKMLCQTSDHRGTTQAIYFFVFVYDVEAFANTTTLTATIKEPGESMSIVCQCFVPEGYFCSIAWTKIANPPDISKTGSITTLVFLKDHLQGPVTHSCFSAVFVIGHPSTYNMVELPEARKTKQQTINGKDFKKQKGEVISPNIDKNKTIKDDSPSAKNSSDKSKSSSLHPGVIALIVIIILLAIIGVLGFVFWKRSKLSHAKNTTSKIKQDKSGGDVQTKTKETRKRSSAASSQNSRVKQEMPDDVHFLSSADLIDFLSRMENTITSGKTLDALEGCLRQLKKVPVAYPKIVSQIEQLRDIMPSGKYLLTCRKTRHLINPKTYVGNSADLHNEAGDRLETLDLKGLHMNFATDNKGIRSYILSQAPTESEMETFLKFVCENKVSLIVSMTSPNELRDDGLIVRDFFPYYNLPREESTTYGIFDISCMECIQTPSSEIRQLLIRNKKTNASFSVSVLTSNILLKVATPQSAAQLVHLCQTINRQFNFSAGITLVHCVNGLGMSCVLVALLNCMDAMKKKNFQGVNVFRIVEKLRKERIGAIETGDQFCLLYWSVGQFHQRAFLDAAVSKAQKGTANKSVIKTLVKGKQ